MKRRANREGQTLENKIAVDIGEAGQAISALETNIKSLKSTINNIAKNTGISNFTKQVNQAQKSTSVWSKTWSALQKTINFSAIYLGARQALSTLKEMTDASVDYTETVNLFNVSFGKGIEGLNQYYEQAISFQEKLEEKLGINIEESMRYQALFNSMTKSMGLSANYAYTLSENMTKLGYDLASLYNIDPTSAMTKLRAGLAGQTEPLRELGLDITEQSLKPVAESLGIDRSIRNMSQAEKAVLRYIAVLRQATIAQGDFARTMESPANQLRIFNAQVTAFKRNMGNLWQGILGGILPYVNAVMMVINELLKMVAKLFGFEVSSQPINVSESVGTGDLADDLGTASDNAKKLKKQLMGFDEINNITIDNNISSGNGSITGEIGGIDQRLLDALKGYDNLMDSVNNKATELRDKMLEWLGFERDDDGTWKLKEGLTNFEKILDVAKTIGVAIGTWKVSSTITNLLKNLGVLNGKQNFQLAFGLTLALTGIFAQYKGTEHLLDGDIDIFTILETVLGTAGGTFGIANILKATKFGKKLTLGKRLQIGLGIMLGFQGIQVIADGIGEKDIIKQIAGVLETGVGSFISFSSKGIKYGLKMSLVFTLASVDMTLATNIGSWWNEYFETQKKELYGENAKLNIFENLNVGLNSVGEGAVETITNLTSKITEALGVTTISREELNKLKQTTEEVTKSYDAFRESISGRIESSTAEIAVSKELAQELYGLVDSNGKVKKGYETRVDFILNELNNSFDLELRRNGEIITKNGKIVESNTELQKSIEKTIEKRKKEIEQEVYQDIYKETLQQKIKIQNELNKAIDKQKEAQEELNRINNQGADFGTWLVATENLQMAENAVSKLSSTYEECLVDLSEADKNLTNSMVETSGIVSAEMINKGIVTMETLQSLAQSNSEQWNKAYQDLDEATRVAMLVQSTIVGENAPVVMQQWQNLAQGSYSTFKSYMDELAPSTLNSLLATLTTTQGMTPNIVTAWTDLASQSKEQFNQAISSIPPDVQSLILNSIATTEGLTENTKEAWGNLARTSRTEYDKAIANLPVDTRNEIQSTVDEINGKQWEAGQAGSNVGTNTKSNFDTGLGDTNQSGRNFIQGFLDVVGLYSPMGILTTIFNLGGRIVSKFNEGLQEHSPSRATQLSAKYFVQGFTDKIKQLRPNLLGQIENLGVGIVDKFDKSLSNITEFTVNPQDFKINTSQFIDYGAISGNINTQAKVDMRDLPQEVRQAVIDGMSQVSIPIEVEARTDEGVVFTKIQRKANEFYMQTGEPAFGI